MRAASGRVTGSLARLAAEADVRLALDTDRVEVIGDSDRLRQLWIVERHGGTILVTDRADQSSRFSVRLPMRSKPR